MLEQCPSICGEHCDARCHGTNERYVRNVRTSKTPENHLAFRIATPVDNPEIGNRTDRWILADEQFELFITALESHGGRRTRLPRERFELPEQVRHARDFEDETEQLRIFLRGQVAS